MYIYIRGEKYNIEAGKSTDIHIPDYNIIVSNTVFGQGVVIWSNVNIYGAYIGENTKIGSFVEIRSGVKIGKNVKIEPFVFIPEGVIIEDCAFIGPNVTFTNDTIPFACNEDGTLKQEYEIVHTYVKKGASIGAQSVIKCGITIGEHALVGLGSVITRDVPQKAVVYGEHAKIRREIN